MKHLYFLIAVFFLFNNTNAQIVNIPDANFKSLLLSASPTNHVGSTVNPNSSITPNEFSTIDTNNDGQIQISEAEAIIFMSIHGLIGSSIVSLQGIEAFTNLQFLYCNSNSLTSLDVSNCHALKFVNCASNQLTSLNVSGCINLTAIGCSQNNLTALDLTGLNSIQSLYADNNHLTSLNVDDLDNIKWLYLSRNNLNTIHIANKQQLLELNLGYNLLTDIELLNLPHLYKINAQFNTQLTDLDLSGCAYQDPINTEIFEVNCGNNPMLSHINLKNGYANAISLFSSDLTDHAEYICIDEEDNFDQYTFYNSNSLISTYCNFTPGTHYDTISGTIIYDVNNNGCDASDDLSNQIKIAITDGTNGGNTFTNGYGEYAFFVQQPNLIVTPVIENPYFSVSPSNATINFASNNNLSQIQNFCITANGAHPDLEITLLPINGARPGFNSTYKISYKNKGTQTQSGTISFTFNDAVLDLVSAIPVVSSQVSNYLNWNFTNLQPFETREILMTLNLNMPTEVPPVVGGDVLNFTTSVNSSLTDETPNDNTFVLNQTAGNSFDPNDKTCLEGNTITPEMIGKEVHYMIRFENTGTANAENIVVKDIIDTTKFDINSLIPVDGSHPFVTKISNTNRVEFIFENINLPYDDANNDGYVAFKIKTKSDLVVGNSFSNSASIFFDYNFPIITNTATTTVALLANQDFAFEKYFKIYPNPANTILNIDTKKTIEVTSINIYNTLGQVVLVIPNAQQTNAIDVSSLKTGNYFVKINSDKGSSNMKFVKL